MTTTLVPSSSLGSLLPDRMPLRLPFFIVPPVFSCVLIAVLLTGHHPFKLTPQSLYSTEFIANLCNQCTTCILALSCRTPLMTEEPNQFHLLHVSR